MVKVGIIGASGYSGLELIKILLRHSETTIGFITGTSRVSGMKVSDLHPILRGQIDLELGLTDIEEVIKSDVDCVFLATPNETSLEFVPQIIKRSNKKVIDLSGSFRLKNKTLYPEFYGFDNNNDDLLNEAVYGLPEFNSSQIRNARLIANPGCYPTSIMLALAPLLMSNLVSTSSRIVIDSKSGVSGAGRKPTENTHYVETNESFKAYKIHSHRHEPEIKQELSFAAKGDVRITFTPHLLPINRGILSTIYADLKEGVTADQVQKCLEEMYKNKKFVRVLPQGSYPEIKYVANTPFCDVGFSVRGQEIILVSCIDNILKGASSQAVQNYNLMFGFKEDLSL